MDLKQNLIDNILEMTVKLGAYDTAVSFYYPKEELIDLLSCNEVDFEGAMDDFLVNAESLFGPISIQELASEPGRFGVRIPKEGMKKVRESYQPSAFTVRFLSEIHRPMITMEEVLELFREFSEDVVVEEHEGHERAVYFQDESIDPYIYHFERNAFGVEYHRFTRAAYERLMRS